MSSTEVISPEGLEKLYDQYIPKSVQNQIVKGVVVGYTDREVIVSIGYKAEGIIPRGEFAEELPPVGSEIEVYVESLESAEGQVKLSHRLANSVRTWQKVLQAYEKGEIIEGVIKRRTKGGFVVDIEGIEAFLPGSQVDIRPLRSSDSYDTYLGSRMRFKVVKVNPTHYNVVVSHKAVIEEQLETQKEQLIGTLERGYVLKGRVKNIASFGIFVDLGGGIDGLVHVSDLTWGRISHLEELYKIGDEVQVVVLDHDPETKRITLGIKQLQPNPWNNLPETFVENAVVEGTVVVVADYGLKVELAPGIEGLVPVFELSWSTTPIDPHKKYQVGDKIQVKILSIDVENQKIQLSVRQLLPDPWQQAEKKYPVGSRHTGIVKNYTSIGAFIELEPGIEGFLHVQDLSWLRRLRHPSEVLQKGQELEVIILDLDISNRRLRLGHKQLKEDPWSTLETIFTVGSLHEGIITQLSDSGATVELAYGIEGFAPAFHLKNAPNTPVLKEGTTALFKVIEFDKQNRRIVLSHTETWQETKASRSKKASKSEPITRVQKKETLGDLEALAKLQAQLSNPPQKEE
ncbi:MAG: 30S ribosomal protein S1 [Bacteroidia bacterium]